MPCIRLILLIIIWVLTLNNGFSQSSPLDSLISVSYQDKKLSDVLADIALRSGVTFSYSSRVVPVNDRIFLSKDNESVQNILHELLDGRRLEFLEVSGKIVLRKSTKLIEKYTISGFIRDRDDGETLIGATILVHDLNTGVISNIYGFYSLNLPKGPHQMIYTFVGYEDQTETIDLTGNLVLNIDMIPDASLLQEVTVVPDDSLLIIENIRENVIAVKTSSILQKPSVLGESDVIKSLEMVPGVQLFRDGSSFFNVRGGDKDQNQILVDEAPIYNPAHLLGIFSSFMPEAIKDVKFYKGDLPARIGGRISSVLEIQTREGNMHRYGAEGSLGIFSGRLAVEGPLIQDKSSFFLSGRRSYIQSLIRAIDPDFNTLYFTDFSAKTNLRLNHKNRLFLSTYIGKDDFFQGESGINWENKSGTIRWNHVFGPRLFSNTTFYTSKYQYNLDLTYMTWTNHIANVSLRSDFTFYKSPRNTIEFGFKSSGHNFNPGNAEDSLGNIPVGLDFVPKRNATDFSIYFSSDQQLVEKLWLTYGLRLSTWTNFGRTIEYGIDENYEVTDTMVYNSRKPYNDFGYLEPRINITYFVNNKNILKLNYSFVTQYINLISNSISPFNNLEVWLPASINIQPQTSSQISASWHHLEKNWTYSMAPYYKLMTGQLDYSNQARLLLNARLEAEVRSGDGNAYGIEFSAAKNAGILTGRMSYVYSRSFRTIEDVNNGKKYPALWDRPHQVVMNLNFAPSKRSMISGSLYLSSGAPVTTPTAFYRFSGRTVPIYGEKNNSRYPVYNRFDLAWKYRLNRHPGKFSHYLTLSVFNLYGQKNSVLQNFNKKEIENGQFRVPASETLASDLTSTRIFVYSVIPSITYSFKI